MFTEIRDIVYTGLIIFKNIPRASPTQFKSGEATPNIQGNTVAITSGAADIITNLIGGSDGQSLRILGDGSTTIKNNSRIVTNTSADKVLVLNRIYTFTYFDTIKTWFENV